MKKLFSYIKKFFIIIFILNIQILIILLLCALAMVSHYSKNKPLNKADAIIVLGAAAWGNKPSPVYKTRLKYAVILFKENYAKYIIFTGGTPKSNFPTEAQVGAKWALNNNIPEKSIIIENKSRDTIENIKNSLIITKNYNIKSFIIVSDPYHLARAKLISKTLGLNNVQTSPTPYSLFNKNNKKNKIKIIAKETIWILGFFYYKIYQTIYDKITHNINNNIL